MASSLMFSYTAVGAIGYPRVFDVSVDDADWAAPTATADMQGTYTAKHVLADGTDGAGVEALTEIGRQMRARVKRGQTVAAGDMVVFTYSANAPADTGPTSFAMRFDGEAVADLTVNVQSAARSLHDCG